MSGNDTPIHDQIEESRSNGRYVFRVALQAAFAATPIKVIDISASGVQVEHPEAINIGKEGQLSIRIKPGSSFGVPARLVWSRFGKGKAAGEKIYRSGLVFLSERANIAEDILDLLVRSADGSPDAESLKKKRLALSQKRKGFIPIAKKPNYGAGTDSHDLSVARKVSLWFRKNPDEALRWINRASNGNGQRPPGTESLTAEQLAVWEFLERKVDLEIIKLACRL